jgi:hypothetical protein
MFQNLLLPARAFFGEAEGELITLPLLDVCSTIEQDFPILFLQEALFVLK